MTLGVAPFDPDDPIGELRALVGDTEWVTTEPPQEGVGLYAVFSDAALAAALNTAGGSILRAAGNVFARLASEYTSIGRSIRTDDLMLDTKGRGETLLKIAQSFWKEAEIAERNAASDYFVVVPVRGGRKGPVRPPEGTPWPVQPPADLDLDALIPDPDNPGYWTLP